MRRAYVCSGSMCNIRNLNLIRFAYLSNFHVCVSVGVFLELTIDGQNAFLYSLSFPCTELKYKTADSYHVKLRNYCHKCNYNNLTRF